MDPLFAAGAKGDALLIAVSELVPLGGVAHSIGAGTDPRLDRASDSDSRVNERPSTKVIVIGIDHVRLGGARMSWPSGQGDARELNTVATPWSK